MIDLFQFEVKITPGDARSLAGGGCNGRCFFANSNSSPTRACARNKLSSDVVLLPRLPVVNFFFEALITSLVHETSSFQLLIGEAIVLPS